MTSINKSRNLSIDLVRLICAFGVITIHIKSDTAAASLVTDVFWPECVSFFFIISIAFFINGLPYQTLKSALVKTAWRIGVPFISWTLIYSTLILIKKGTAADHFVAWRALLYGESAVHLYFLPSLILMQVYISGIYLLLKWKTKGIASGIFILLAGMAYHTWGYMYQCFGLASPTTFLELPILMLLGLAVSVMLKKQKHQVIYIIIGLFLFIAAVLLNCWGNKCYLLQFPFVIFMGGGGLAMLAAGLPNVQLPEILEKPLNTSYGIYLSHILFLEAFELALKKIVHLNLVYNFDVKLAMAMAVFLASMVFTLVIGRIRVVNTLLLGIKK